MKSAIKLSLQISIAVGCLLNFGCERQESVSEDKGFIANNDSGNNYLLSFLGDSNGIPGTLQDIPKMNKVFNAANGLNFTMPGPYSGGWKYPSNSTITGEIAKAAKAMLEKDLLAWKNMQRGGTLFIYFTSHGAEDGSTSTGGGSSTIQFTEIAKAIRSARGEHPLERLVVFFDTCFSGQNIVGSTTISQKSGGLGLLQSVPEIAQPRSSDPALESFIASSLADANAVKGFYKSAIFIGSSRPNETAGDGESGGVGTEAFIQAINAAKGGSLAGGNTSRSNANGLENILGSLGNQNQENNGNYGLTQSETPTTLGSNSAGAGAGKGPSTTTIKAVLQKMVSNASGQTPVFCVEPKELADDFFFDPPEGYLPANPANALKTGAENRECSR